MKLAFDFNDTTRVENGPFFSAITRALRRDGHKIYIITDSFTGYDSNISKDLYKQRRKKLFEMGIYYNLLIITGDKEEFCKKEGIDYMIDNRPNLYFTNSEVIHLQLIFNLGLRR